MGRKIPAKKHRGVKDPLVQQARRLQRLQGRVNSPPRDPDEQPVPRSLLRLLPAPGPAASAPAKRAPSKRSSAPLGALRRGAGEGARSFSSRISAAVRALSTPADALSYPADMENDEEETRPERSGRRQRGAGREGASRQQGASRQKGAANRKQRRRQRLQEKRHETRRTAAQDRAQAPQYERVPFGEVAARPPQLPKPVKAGGRGAGRGEALRLAAVEAYRALKRQRRDRPTASTQ